MNTVEKGNRAVKERRIQLEQEGWILDKKQKGSGGKNDLFGMFDILAIKGHRIRLEQVKSNTTQGAIKKIKEWILLHNPNQCIEYYIAVRHDGAGARKVRWAVKEIKEAR